MFEAHSILTLHDITSITEANTIRIDVNPEDDILFTASHILGIGPTHFVMAPSACPMNSRDNSTNNETNPDN